MSARGKDPRGGLNAAGRRAFRKSEGANLKPGVRKKIADMTPEEMRGKGSWATRFYGRSGKLPALRDASDPLCADGARLGRACPENAGGGASHRRKGPALAGAL